MKFIADMGISYSTCKWLRDKGYDAIHLRERGLQRITDFEIMTIAKKEYRIILTFDLDFGNLISASGWKCPSIIIFRLENETPININKRLAQVLKESSQALESGAVISVEETRHRVRLLPFK